jgi:hypothetical protein
LSGWPKAVLGNAVGGMLGEELKKLNAYEWRVNKIVTNEDSLQSAMMNILQRQSTYALRSTAGCTPHNLKRADVFQTLQWAAL